MKTVEMFHSLRMWVLGPRVFDRFVAGRKNLPIGKRVPLVNAITINNIRPGSDRICFDGPVFCHLCKRANQDKVVNCRLQVK